MISETVQIIDPRTYPDWDRIVESSPGSSFFHSYGWARTLSDSYGYAPFYFTIFEKGKIKALISLMEIDSVLTGKRGVSLPFTDYCTPIAAGGMSFSNFFDYIVAFGKNRGWKRIELRGGQSLFPEVPSFASYLAHTVDLGKGEEKTFSRLRESTRRNIKRARTQGVAVEVSREPEAVKEFYRLNVRTRKEHGLPPQPYRFFRMVYEHVISRGGGFVALASYRGRNIAGAIFFHFADKAIYKFGASDKKYRELRGNYAVMWESIQWLARKGFASLSFGRTEMENKGLQQYKTGWGPEESRIDYLNFDLRRGAFVAGKRHGVPSYTYILRELPVSVLNLLGSAIYRHVG